MLRVNENLRICHNKNNNKKNKVDLCCICMPKCTTGITVTVIVNKSYRRYVVGRTASAVVYVQPTLVNSHPDHKHQHTNMCNYQKLYFRHI